jgi:hypothetical protein
MWIDAEVSIFYCIYFRLFLVTCQRYQINAMPTFVLFVRGREVDRLQGANPDRIRQLVELHMKDPPKQSSVKANPSEIEWLRKNLVSHVDHVKLYEDEINQTIALSIIPLDEINQKAMVDGKLSVFEQARYLMDWFHSCFKWVDKPGKDYLIRIALIFSL